MLSVRCPSCGKHLLAPDEEAGRRILCTACGQWLELPEAPPVAEQAASPQASVAEGAGGRHGWQLAVVVLAGLGLILLLLSVLMTLPERVSGDRRQQLVELKHKADEQVVHGDLPGAYATYSRLQRLAAEAEPLDEELKGQLREAAASQERLVGVALQAATRPAPVAVPATGPAVALPTSRPVITPPVALTQPATRPVDNGAVTKAPTDPPPYRPTRPAVRRLPPSPDAVLDERIGQAINRGAAFLMANFEDGRLRARSNTEGAYYTGMNALCAYALLQCGQAIREERLDPRNAYMRQILSALKEMPAETSQATYARSLRALALALSNQPDDRTALKADAAWLMENGVGGGYTYDARRGRSVGGGGIWDNSNSQYGLLGVWSAAEVGIEVPPTYWKQVEKHWMDCQLEDGQWGYTARSAGGGYLAMTCAGLASLFVTHDWLDAAKLEGQVGRPPFTPALASGLAWLERGDNCINLQQSHWGEGYVLYGLERVGLASGFKYFGKHDWYRELAEDVVARQRRDGSWGRFGGRIGGGDDDLVETAYELLFLARGRHPILMNKLRFDGFWANRPRDLANLTRFAAREMERPLNWQVVSFDRDWSDWTDCPVLYLSSHVAPRLTDLECDKLRAYVLAGGMLYTQADGNAEAFNRFVTELGRRLFPEYEFRDLPLRHEIYSVNYRVDPKPPLKYLGNGTRLFMLHSPQDLAAAWQQRAEKTKRNAFELGVNIAVYAAGKTDLRNRLLSTHLPPPPVAATMNVTLARLRYAGAWNPEPHAFQRFARWFQYETGMGLAVTNVDLAELKLSTAPVAHLTGNASYTPTPAEITALRKYVDAGGVVVMDACGGSMDFATSVRAGLDRTFGDGRMTLAGPQHPLRSGGRDGMDSVPVLKVRPYTMREMGAAAGRLEIVQHGRGAVVFSPLDLTTGLLGTRLWDLGGLDPATAQSIMKNAILWALDGVAGAPRD